MVPPRKLERCREFSLSFVSRWMRAQPCPDMNAASIAARSPCGDRGEGDAERGRQRRWFNQMHMDTISGMKRRIVRIFVVLVVVASAAGTIWSHWWMGGLYWRHFHVG